MENKKEKTAAELYREERKQRMAKAAKKNSKKSPQLHKIGQKLGKCVTALVVIAIILGVVYFVTDFSGILQRNILKPIKVGNTKISAAEYNYYYMSQFTYYSSMSKQYDSTYGEGYGKMYVGYDTSKAPDKQSYTMGEVEGYDDPTWADFLDDTTRKQLQVITAFSEKGRAAGVELTEDQTTELEETITEYKDQASTYDFSLNRFLVKNFGKGVNENVVRKCLEDRYIAQNYAEQQSNELKDSITEEDILAEYKANLRNYTNFSIAIFEYMADIPETAEDASEDDIAAAKTVGMAQAKQNADSIITSVNSLDAFLAAASNYDSELTKESVVKENITASTLSSYSSDAADWIYETGRAVGDKNVFEVSDGYYLVYVIATPAGDTTKGVDVRHILVKFETSTDDEGNTVELTAEQKAEYLAKAQQIYAEYQQNPTEDNFASLAGLYTDDTGSKENGGLYENVFPGDMVDEFNDWIFDAARKPGDTDIIETTYGYHIMYYVGNNHLEKWANSAKESIASEREDALYTDVTESTEYALEVTDYQVNWLIATLNKYIAERLTSA